VPIVGAGGVMSAEDAYRKIRAGASLVQVYTGLIYGGPAFVRRVNEGLAALLARDGFARVADAVGADLAGEGAPGRTPGVSRTR
jgi:dihydroorotate dehydrogenase